MILLFCSCKEKSENQKTEQNSEQNNESKSELKTELELDADYSISAELFAKEVLKENIRTHVFELANSQKPKHLEIFKSDGLQKIVAYSNKNYPKKSEPNYYEHFTLFVATYNSQNTAKETFDLIKSGSKYGVSEWRELESDQSERVKALNIGAKPGGMITQIGNQIFSLVETCRKVPFGANWIEYENRLIKYLTRTGNEEFEVLNSDCGNDRYEFKIIKASR